jgi:hypothetical protein
MAVPGFVISLVKAALVLASFLALFVNNTATDEQEVKELSTTRREIVGSGFHLQLITRITLASTDPNEFKRCKVGLVEKLPREAFIDPDQTKESERFLGMGGAKVNVLVKPFVDIEKPAAMSVPCDYVVGWQDQVLGSSFREAQIPFHLRYQAPGESGYGAVDVSPPIVCSTCALVDFTESTSKIHAETCQKHFGAGSKPYASSNKDFTEPKVVYVPVGNPADKEIILYSTIAVVTVGTVAVMWATWSSSL